MQASTDNQGLVLVIDQSLQDNQGHFFECSRTFHRFFERMGFEVKLFCNNKASEAMSPDLSIQKVFHQTWLDRTLPQALLAFVNLSLASIGLKKMNRFLRFSFGDDLENQIVRLDPAKPSLFFVHTLNFIQLAELISICIKYRDRPFTFGAVIRQDPRDSRLKILKSLLFWLISNCLKQCPNLFLFTDTGQLSLLLEKILRVPVAQLPIPFLLPLEVSEVPLNKFQVCFLGDARLEKGFHLLPTLVEPCINQNPNVKFCIQVCFPKNEVIPLEIKRAQQDLSKLESRFPKNLVLYHGPLSDSLFYEILCRSMVVLIPYDPNRYRFRSSGILSQSIALGKITVVPHGMCLPEKIATENLRVYRSCPEATNFIREICMSLMVSSESVLAPIIPSRINANTFQKLKSCFLASGMFRKFESHFH